MTSNPSCQTLQQLALNDFATRAQQPAVEQEALWSRYWWLFCDKNGLKLPLYGYSKLHITQHLLVNRLKRLVVFSRTGL
jgi:hypothetical protein